MKCFFCDKPVKGVTRITDPILLAGLAKKVQIEAQVIGQREYLVCEDHHAALTGRSKQGVQHDQK